MSTDHTALQLWGLNFLIIMIGSITQLDTAVSLIMKFIFCFSFHLGFAAVKIYCNEENSRTFISLDVDPFTQRHLLNLTKKVDGVLNEFQLPTFYEVCF